MTISQRPWYLVFALLPLLALALATCGGDDDGDEAFELPAPGEYSFNVTGTIEVEFLEPGVSAAPLALGGHQTVQVEGSLKLQAEEDGTFTISKDGVVWVAGKEVEGGGEGGELPITFTLNEDKPSTIKIPKLGGSSKDPVMMEVWLNAESIRKPPPGQPTNVEPIKLESDGDLFSAEGATFTTPPDAEPVSFEAGGGTPSFAFLISNVLLDIELEEETDEPPPAATPVPTEDTGEITGPEISLGCEHVGGAESNVIMKVQNLKPQQTIEGKVTGADVSGGINAGFFRATADEDGTAEARVYVDQRGIYEFELTTVSDGGFGEMVDFSGTITVGEVCTPP